MRNDLLVIGYVVVNAVIFVAVLWGRSELNAFLREHQAIERREHLDRFKAMVRRQMLAVVALIPLVILSFAGAVYIAQQMGLLGLTTVLGTSAPIFIVGRDSKQIELRARTLKTADELGADYQRVCHAWVKQLLPRF